jgi:curved DNA-binding protein
MRFEDYYQVMGLNGDADAAAIKQAYRRLARLYHPDLNQAPEAHAAMLKVNEAHEVLSDPQRRAAYDGVRRRHRALRAAVAAPPAAKPPADEPDLAKDWQQGFNFEGAPTAGRSGEGFSDFFTSMFGRSAKPEPPDAKPERGADEHVKLMIDAADAVDGAVRSVTVRTLAPDEKGHRAVMLRQVQVQVPKGIRAGQHIRLAGQGSAGQGGAAAGDLYLEVQFKRDPAGQAATRDVHEHLPLAPWEAALGTEVTTTTPAGKVSVTVPPDTPDGKRLRLRGHGLAGEPAGDMVLEVDVVLPPSTLPGARAAYEAMSAILAKDFHPRDDVRAVKG